MHKFLVILFYFLLQLKVAVYDLGQLKSAREIYRTNSLLIAINTAMKRLLFKKNIKLLKSIFGIEIIHKSGRISQI